MATELKMAMRCRGSTRPARNKGKKGGGGKGSSTQGGGMPCGGGGPSDNPHFVSLGHYGQYGFATAKDPS